MEDQKRASFLCALFGVAAMLLGGCGALTLWQRPALELRAARSRWAALQLSHYQLDLKYGALGYCRQSIEVKDGRVVAVLDNTCSEPAPTVDQLFDQIERSIRTAQGHCGPNGCACDGTISVIAEYDPRMGYPRTKGIALEPLARWQYPDYWKQRLVGRLCSSLEISREIITVVALKRMA
ncbi:MAG TPA: DUF6174 domain-containing protein [Roseiflexaceae bacterium]|nr:DUF6174 domain-containing protein [Roseiflexaceae bacterium]